LCTPKKSKNEDVQGNVEIMDSAGAVAMTNLKNVPANDFE
jgi:hypothetical protein